MLCSVKELWIWTSHRRVFSKAQMGVGYPNSTDVEIGHLTPICDFEISPHNLFPSNFPVVKLGFHLLASMEFCAD